MSKHSPYGNGSRAKVCRECGRHEDEAGSMSARALCSDCGHDRANGAADQLSAGRGPHYDEWRRALIELGDRLSKTV